MLKTTFFLAFLLLLASCGGGNQIAIDKKNTELKLSKKGLTGVPENIGEMPQIKRLYLDGNAIADLGSGLEVLTELLEIDLSYNQLEAIPDGLGGLTKMQLFDASYNKLTVFPKALLSMPDLQHIDLRENKLTSLPPEIKSLKKLEVIYLSGNDFTKEQRVEYRNWLPRTKIIWSDGAAAK